MRASAAHVPRCSFPAAADLPLPGWLAFSCRRFSRPLGASFGSQRAARGRVDSLVTIVPADPIARRWLAAQDFLNDTRARSTAR